MINTEKLAFITHDFIEQIKNADTNAVAKWGKMNFQQMIEHVADFFKVSTNEIQFPLVTPVEHLPKYKEFLYSDKVFRENTKAPVAIIGEEPLPQRNASVSIAIQKLENNINQFVQYFQENPLAKTMHPVFGNLNFEEWILLHYKHVTHHAKQFSLM